MILLIWKKLLEEHRAGKFDNSRKIWTVYIFLLWYERLFCKWETSASGDEQQVEKVQNRRSRWQHVGKSCGKGRERKLNILTISLLAVLIFIICFGLIMLYSASAYNSQAANNGDGMYLFRRQAMVTAGSFCCDACYFQD